MMRYSCWFWTSCCLAIVGSAFAQEEGAPLLSSHLVLQKNDAEHIVLSWKIASPGREPERVLLFIPGEVSAATYTVSHFTWRLERNGEIAEEGDETSYFSADRKREPPRVALRDIGFLAGCRLAVLNLTVQIHEAVRWEEGNESVVFPTGELEIRFSANDLDSFKDFPVALDEIARKMVLNYPPLRVVSPSYAIQERPLYFDMPTLPVVTRAQGIVRLSAREILPVLESNSLMNNLALFRERKPIPFIVTDSQGKQKKEGNLKADDWVQFYSPASRSPYSPETVIWCAPVPTSYSTAAPINEASGTGAVDVLERRLVLEEDRDFIEDNDKNEGQADFWMWHEFIKEGTKTIDFSAPAGLLDRSATASFRLCTSQTYITIATNTIDVRLNGRQIEPVLNRIQPSEFRVELPIAAGVLVPGTNTLLLQVQSDRQTMNSEAGIYLDWIEFRIPSRIIPSEEPYWNPKGVEQIPIPPQIGGVWLVRNAGDSPGDVLYSKAGSETIRIPSPADSWRIYLLPDRRGSSPAVFKPIVSPLAKHALMADDGGADVIFVAPQKWLSVLQPFEDYLRVSKYRVRHAAIEDIENCFGDGRLSPYSLREFLCLAFHRWQRPQPSYVLLAGDATWDYWGRFNNGVRNYVPAYREEVKYAVENWFVRCDDPKDPLPDAIIARWPVQSATELEIVVEKTLRYKKEPPLDSWLNRVFVLTDDTFERYSQELIEEWIPPAMRLLQRHIADYSLMDNIYLPERLREQMRAKTSPAATDEIIQILSQGLFLWNYFGHGAPNVIGNERMFFGGGSKYSDVRKLTNGVKLPMLWAFTCQTAEFDYPREKWNVSIGEDMLTFPGGGTIALVGATGRGYPTDHIILARGMHQAAFRDRFSTLGQIFFAANLYGLSHHMFFEPMNQFAILGDPTLVFPDYRTLEGEAHTDEKEIEFQWKNVPGNLNPGSYSLWAETDRAIVTEDGRFQSTLRDGIVKGTFQPEDLSTIRKVGIDSIQKRNDRIAVFHGAIPFRQEIPAATFIEPATGRLPDLTFVPGSLKWTPEKPRSGETIFLKAVLKNTGMASAADFTVQGHQLQEGNVQNMMNAKVGKTGFTVERIDPGQDIPIQIRWDPTHNAGVHKVQLTADSGNRIAEIDEENNRLSAELTVLRKADLIVDASSVDVQPIEGGKRLQLYFEIRNQGESLAEKVIVELIRKDIGVATPETFRIPQTYDFQPGTHRAFGGIKIPASIEFLEIVIDPDEIVDEESHANNRYRYEKN